MKKLGCSILSLIVVTALFFLFVVGLGLLQQKVFVPNSFIMWIFKYPESRFIFIYLAELVIAAFYIGNRNSSTFLQRFVSPIGTRKTKRILIWGLILLNGFLFYVILFSVAVLTPNAIINYSFVSPHGKLYSYNDVKKIQTGLYGNQSGFPFSHEKGDFFYFITLDDGVKINLAEAGGFKNSEEDERFVINRLDPQLVAMGISKTSSMANFSYTKKELGKQYTDEIRKILERKNGKN